MGNTSKIEWTDATWNPVTGCTKVSPGCDHCYAEGIAERFRGPAFPNGFEVTLREARLTEPLRWRKPRRVFVNSMSDLFHEGVPDEYIARVFAVMSCAPQHTFQVLTKRHARLRSLLSRPEFERMVLDAKVGPRWTPMAGAGWEWPLPNVWLGVSVESQQWADIRVRALVQTPAAVRFVSCEPLLGAVSLTASASAWGRYLIDDIDWVIVGGESGGGARPMHPWWARLLRDECIAHETAFFFKQWGNWAPVNLTDQEYLDGEWWLRTRHPHVVLDNSGEVEDMASFDYTLPFGWQRMVRSNKHDAGRTLDGRTWDEYPRNPLSMEAV